jgi:hypothetical protein
VPAGNPLPKLEGTVVLGVGERGPESWQARNAGAMVAAVRNAPWTIRDGGMPILAS